MTYFNEENTVEQLVLDPEPLLAKNWVCVICLKRRGSDVLSKSFYAMAGKKGVYTRKKGLGRDTNKALLLKHIKDNKSVGSRLQELLQVLPSLTVDQVKTLLREMKKDEQIHVVGRTSSARWFPGSG